MTRITFFTYDRQIDRRALLQCKTLLEHGYNITLYALADKNITNDPPFVQRIGAAKNTTARLPFALRLRQWLEIHCAPLFRYLLPPLRFIYWRLPGKSPARLYLSLYRETLDNLHPADLYIAHDLPMLPVAIEAKRRYGGKVLYDSHELFPDQQWTQMETRMWRTLEAEMIPATDGVITINPSIAEIMKTRYHLREVGVVYNAEWLSAGDPARGRRFHEILSLPSAARILLYQGGLSFERNLESLIGAMPYVTDVTIHLVFLGTGPAIKKLQALTASLRLQARVHFIPAVPQSELLAYTQSADLGVIPYYDNCLNYRYCTPNKLFEFIAAGLPIIATDLPEITRILAEHRIGFTDNTRDLSTLASLILRGLEPSANQALRQNLLRVRQHINWQNEGEHFAGLVAKVLTDPTPA
ncbi:MAG: glycosyltransferase [Alphaproteobacteria bacterium]|jgi:glycosyltransferase involved in cell wall biosynthesis